MAINPICDVCKKVLDDFGALLFSPPDSKSTVRKYHVCQDCYQNICEQNGLN